MFNFGPVRGSVAGVAVWGENRARGPITLHALFSGKLDRPLSAQAKWEDVVLLLPVLLRKGTHKPKPADLTEISSPLRSPAGRNQESARGSWPLLGVPDGGSWQPPRKTPRPGNQPGLGCSLPYTSLTLHPSVLTFFRTNRFQLFSRLRPVDIFYYSWAVLLISRLCVRT